MRQSDLILYLGILMLVLGLVSWFVGKDRTVQPTVTPPALAIPEIPESPDDGVEVSGPREREDGLLAYARDLWEAVRQEGDRRAHRVWKDGLTDGQRVWLTSIGSQFGRLKDFTLSLQFLLIIVCSALLVGIYHLVNSGKLQRMIRKSS